MFQTAIPVFAEGKEREKNAQLVLRATCDDLRGTTLYITAFSFYRLSVNDRFVAFGPARTAGGYARVDELSLDAYHREGGNEITIEVAGYYCNCLSTVRQPSFVVCELRRGEDVLLATGRDFAGYTSHRVQKAERYSIQRHFGEVWDLRAASEPVALVPAENRPTYLPRRVPYPTYEIKHADGAASVGRFAYDESLPCMENRYSGTAMQKPSWGQYLPHEAVTLPFRWIQKQAMTQGAGKTAFPITLHAGEYVTVDFDRIEAGFLGFSVEADSECNVVVGFSELCDPAQFAFTNINCQNVIEYFLPTGETEAASFEPYTCRVAVLMVKSGTLTLRDVFVRTYEFDRARILDRPVHDPALRAIVEAAKATFAHNAVDLYSDCPSRERAGWLCDSFFTGRAEYFLTGESRIEEAFLENFRLYTPDGSIPDGALPMCYPSDDEFGKFIPQWDMWYVLEVKEYLTERKPSADREAFRESVYGILRFLARHENADGLLQNLPSWNFVEWSTANEWVQDVNYPTNFLYAAVLDAAAELYGEAALSEKAARVRATTREKAFDGTVFVDHAVRGEDGVLRNLRDCSEAGQYYALLFGGVSLDDPAYATLRALVRSGFADFDPDGRSFVPVNAFIGFYLRLCLLMELSWKEELIRDVKQFFGGMVASTGTLWEYKQFKGSFDHGFASLAALAIDFAQN